MLLLARKALLFFAVIAVATACTPKDGTKAREECPDGGYITGAAPPDGTQRGCELRDKDGTSVRHGQWVEWYLNGQKQKEGLYFNGNRQGKWTWWYPSGQKMQEGSFTDDRAVGTWSYWDENGKPQSEPSKNATGEGKSEKKTQIERPGFDDFANSLQKSFKR